VHGACGRRENPLTVRKATRMSTPLDEQSIAMICHHMNDDHADAILGYARTFASLDDAVSAQMIGFDTVGMDLAVETAKGKVAVRIAFDHEIRDSDDARDTLIAMARA